MSRQTLTHKVIDMGRDIKLSHSIFAMPIALLAGFMAAGGLPEWWIILLLVMCMFFARTYAMLANRYLDREIDARNPRTQGRAIPAGRLNARDVLLGMILCGALLVLSASGFYFIAGNWWPFVLSPVALLWLGTYGLFKRFTWLCHVYLGGALGLSPIGAALAVNPSVLVTATVDAPYAFWAYWLLAGFLILWVAGFDIIYALQDLESDKEEGVNSIPVTFGRFGALWISRFMHAGCLTCLLLAGRYDALLGRWFEIAAICVGILLLFEHQAVIRGKFTMAFFTINGVISVVIGVVGIVEVLRLF